MIAANTYAAGKVFYRLCLLPEEQKRCEENMQGAPEVELP